MDDWTPVDAAARNQAGQWQVLSGGQWKPATGVAKNEQGKYVALMQTAPAAPTAAPRGESSQSFLSSVAGAMPFPLNVGMGIGEIGARKVGEASRQLEEVGHKAGEKTLDITGSPFAATAVDVGIGQSPMFLTGGFGGEAAAAKPLGSAARRIFQSALKPKGEELLRGDAAKAIDYMLEKGINVSKGGLAKMKAEVERLDKQIDGIISSSTSTVNKAQVGSYLKAAMDRLRKRINFSADSSDFKAVEEAWEEFRDHIDLKGKMDIPIQKAQELKKGVSPMLHEKIYSGEQVPSAKFLSWKELQTGLREEIAKAHPDIKQPNSELSRTLNALDVSELRILYEANKNPIGLGILAGRPETFAVWMADRSALMKSILARTLNAKGMGAFLGISEEEVRHMIKKAEENR